LSIHFKVDCLFLTGSLALIEAEILLCRGSAQKIEAESGTMPPEKPNLSAAK